MQKPKRSPSGDRPETPIHLEVESQIEKHLQSKKCKCGQIFQGQQESFLREAATFDGHRLIIVHLQCGKCSHNAVVYFEVAAKQFVKVVPQT
jgi:hypothetical protein